MTSAQQDQWERNFADAEKVKASIRYGATIIMGDKAEATFNLNLVIVNKETKLANSFTSKQRATLVRQGGRWQIVSLNRA